MTRLPVAALFMVALLALPAATASATDLQITCDFDGNGAEDLAIGVPFEDIGALADAGAVNVIYGATVTGLDPAAGPGDQIWHQDSPGIEGMAEAGDLFGASLTCGNFNGDGFDDLAIGVPEEDIGVVVDAGAVNVIYGSGTGLDPAAGPGDQLWHQNSPGIEGKAEAGDLFGESLASGDFNAGGKDDLAIGAPGEDVGAIADAGAVNVIYGSGAGLAAAAGPGDQLWHQDSPGVEGGAEAGDLFGDSLGAGDFNGDGKADLAIGVRHEDIGALVDAGAVNVIYGAAGGLDVAAVLADQLWHQDSPGVAGMAEADDLFGFSVRSGDFDSSGWDDLAIGVPFEDIGALVDAGAVNVIYGATVTGLDPAAGPGDQIWHQDSPGIEGVAEAGDLFGISLASGAYDGFVGDDDDLAIGVPLEDIGSIVDAGAVNVIYGNGGLAPANGPGDQIWHQNSPGVAGMAEADDLFGFSLASGNYNLGAVDDLAIGVNAEDIGALVDAGAVNVVYGDNTGSAGLTPAGPPSDQLWHQNSPGVAGIAEADDFFGDSLGEAPPP